MLTPLEIVAYKDDRFESEVGKYQLQINPESFSHTHAVDWKPQNSTKPAPEVRLATLPAQNLSFFFYVDGTGVLAGADASTKKYRIQGVMEKIGHFKRLAYSVNGDIHKPNFLIVLWGKLRFKCRLNKLDIDYQLFDPTGIPLRAKVTVGFTEYLSDEEINKRLELKSPDLTHARTVIAGDTLPLMCHRIYGDSRYYLAVAEANQLRDFRNLQPGTRILFPPLTR